MLKVKVLKGSNLPLFKRMMSALRTDKEFQRMTEHVTFYNYIDAIRIEEFDLLESDDDTTMMFLLMNCEMLNTM